MKMRKSISKIMALLLAVTVMVSMIAIPAMAETAKPQYTAANNFGDYTSAQFNADLNAATNYAFFDFEGETKSSDWETQAVSFSEDIKGTDANLTLDWSGTNGGKWLYVNDSETISGTKTIWVNSGKESTITINNTEELKATAIGWLSRPRGTSGRGTTITVNYSDGTSKAFPQYTLPGNGVSFLGFKAEQGTYITSISFSAASAILYYDDICVIMEDPYARDYYRADRVTGGDMTDYTMEQFVSALDNAEYKIVENFDGVMPSAFSVANAWIAEDFSVDYTVNSDESIKLTWQNSHASKRFQLGDTDPATTTMPVSGSKYLITGSGDTYLTFTQKGDFKITQLGFAVSELNLNSAPTFEVSYSGGTKEVVSDAVSKAKVPHFYGFKAPEGEYITRLVIKSGTYSYVDDLCLILEDQSVDYSDLEYATEMLQIYGDNFTEYVPLDSFGAQQDEREPRITISWASSDPTVVTTDGKVYPVVGVEKKVKLTATLRDKITGETATKEFTVTIPAVSEYVIEGVKLTGTDRLIDTQLVAGKKIEKISVKRYENSRQNITVVTALYDGQKNLADVKIETVPVTISAQAHGDITLTNPLTLPSVITGYTAKIMILSSKNELVPLCPDYTVSPMSQDITVFMVGDSLTADYTNSYYPRTGWGSCVETYLDGVTVDNLAVSGMTAKTFMTDGTKLPRLEENVKEGDYIFLMLGHNDPHTKSRTWPMTVDGKTTNPYVNIHTGIGNYNSNVSNDTLSYFGYISNIVKVAREKKANIVFFAPFARATTDRTKMYGYPEAMTAFATEQNLPIVDTTTTSFALYEKLLEKGEELVIANKATDAVSFANNIFLYLTVNDPRYIDVPEFATSSYNKAEGTEDGTHFNVLGANVRTKLAVLGLVGANNALARFENVTEADFNALCDSVIADILATEYYGKAN